MGTLSIGHWLVVLLVVLIVFGAGRLPKTMGELAKGVRAFRAGLKEENADADAAVPADAAAAAPAAPSRIGHAPVVGAPVAGRTEVRGE